MYQKTNKLFKTTLVYLLPLLCILLLLWSFPFFVLVVSGEFTPLSQVINKQLDLNQTTLYGTAYLNQDGLFKLQSTLAKKPQVLMLGTSRSMEFRSKFFNPNISFYNASVGAAQLKYFSYFLDSLPQNSQPNLIILGLDQNFFNPNWSLLWKGGVPLQFTQSANKLAVLQNQWSAVYLDYLKGRVNLKSLDRDNSLNQRYGLNALIKGDGFRNDGSFTFASHINIPQNAGNEKRKTDFIYQRIETGTDYFEYSQNIATDSVNLLDIFLAECKARDIAVVAFLPPYMHSIYQQMISDSQGHYLYLSQLNPTLQPIFAKYGFQLFNFSDLSSVGASDVETIDGFHPSEKASLRMFINMATQSAQLKPKSDISRLKKDLDGTKSNYDVYQDSY